MRHAWGHKLQRIRLELPFYLFPILWPSETPNSISGVVTPPPPPSPVQSLNFILSTIIIIPGTQHVIIPGTNRVLNMWGTLTSNPLTQFKSAAWLSLCGQGRPEKFGGPGQNLTWGPLRFYIVVVLSVRGSGGEWGKILKSEVLEIAKSCTLWGCLSLFLLHTSFSFYVGPPLAGGPVCGRLLG